MSTQTYLFILTFFTEGYSVKQVPFFSVKQAPNFTFSVKHVGNNVVRKFIVAYFGKQVPWTAFFFDLLEVEKKSRRTTQESRTSFGNYLRRQIIFQLSSFFSQIIVW
jgi:hypothetical protein